MLIDTHCHPYMCKHTDIPTYIGNFKSAGGTQMISIGIDIETSKQSIELATTHPEIYTSIGIHPSDI
ncbi:MAG: TatD family hydrolase [Candidatus Peribacteria bacterium]|nr:MAG: TatD family hydrolase [Candidatus Peribacteria bacterium]